MFEPEIPNCPYAVEADTQSSPKHCLDAGLGFLNFPTFHCLDDFGRPHIHLSVHSNPSSQHCRRFDCLYRDKSKCLHHQYGTSERRSRSHFRFQLSGGPYQGMRSPPVFHCTAVPIQSSLIHLKLGCSWPGMKIISGLQRWHPNPDQAGGFWVPCVPAPSALRKTR